MFVSHVECSQTQERYPAHTEQHVSRVGAPLLVRYDLDAIRQAITREQLVRDPDRPQNMWRYRELLPFRDIKSVVSLGECMTPLLSVPVLAQHDGPLWIKDESRLPTASFKARGLAMAVTLARELGASHMAMPTNGNAGSALAAYAARAGMQCTVYAPDVTPATILAEIEAFGAHLHVVRGLIHDCGGVVRAGAARGLWYDCSTLREPYRVEGKKTMGLELAEQFQWDVPDVVLFPTGGGVGIIGLWKAFTELRALGWIRRLPRLLAVQAAACCPLVQAWEAGAATAAPWPVQPPPQTCASGLRVPLPPGGALVLRALRDTDGAALAVDETAIGAAQRTAAARTGLLMSPEGAAALAGYGLAVQRGLVRPGERVVVFNCASGLKYPLLRERDGTTDRADGSSSSGGRSMDGGDVILGTASVACAPRSVSVAEAMSALDPDHAP